MKQTILGLYVNVNEFEKSKIAIDELNSRIKIEPIESPELTETLTKAFNDLKPENLEFAKKVLHLESLNIEDFDFKILNKSYIDENFDSAYGISAKYLKSNDTLFALYFDKDAKSAAPTLVMASPFEIIYVDLEYGIALKLETDNKNNLVSFTLSNSLIETSGLSSKATPGSHTLACINDAYTNHGWISVWAFVQTAFLPETAVAIAAACAVKNHFT